MNEALAEQLCVEREGVLWTDTSNCNVGPYSVGQVIGIGRSSQIHLAKLHHQFTPGPKFADTVAVKIHHRSALEKLQYPVYNAVGLDRVDDGWVNALHEVDLLLKIHGGRILPPDPTLGNVCCVEYQDEQPGIVRIIFLAFVKNSCGEMVCFIGMNYLPKPVMEVVTEEHELLTSYIHQFGLENEPSSVLPIFSLTSNIATCGFWLYTEERCKSFARDLLRITQSLHKKRICHKDIKPNNMRLCHAVRGIDVRRVPLPHDNIDIVPQYHYANGDALLRENQSAKIIGKLDEMATFLWRGCGTMFPESNISPELISPSNSTSNVVDNLTLYDFNTAEQCLIDRFCIFDSQGTTAFVSPECLDPRAKCVDEHGNDLGFDAEKRDVWAIGITLFCMLYGRPPYWTNESNDGLGLIFQIIGKEVDRVLPPDCPHHVVKGLPNLPDTPHFVDGSCELCRSWLHQQKFVSDDCKAFIGDILRKDPKERLDIESALRHSWLSS